ncbi:Cysteine-rich receptor-like protein kinase [Sesamum angolense]|uniref:Cysteine-rich receptor-like protein kinase n=1 Tax=Sesamum angolense TaxID=2727404 RepID=A0AAE2BN80_9LAMI|nr:Cysteine-rich receptor-like protein kinase [Sesamum angolense]
MSKPRSFLRSLIKPFTSNSSRDRNEVDLEKIAAQGQREFSYDTLVAATKNFDPTLKLGEGGFGPVYKGKLDDGREIAVKKLSQGSAQGKKEFQSESKLLARVQHRNVVKLLGYCVFGAEKLLVYQYVANESLDKLLFKHPESFLIINSQRASGANSHSSLLPNAIVDKFPQVLGHPLQRINLIETYFQVVSFTRVTGHQNEVLTLFHGIDVESDRREFLDWKKRYDVITGIAKGLLYLHEEAPCRIIHRDIKASNILLDEKWVPKISDFGMARLYPEDETHVNTRVAGLSCIATSNYILLSGKFMMDNSGYMAPEYLIHGHLSEKADVFSFGVVVLELITGQKNSKFNRDPDSQSLLEWVKKRFLGCLQALQEAKEFGNYGSALESSADADQIAMCIHIGLLCVQSDPKSRPDMDRVVVMLSKKHSSIVEEPTRPGYPGSRYRMPPRPTASSSASGPSGASSSQSFGSSSTLTATTSSIRIPRLDPHGKRPVKD